MLSEILQRRAVDSGDRVGFAHGSDHLTYGELWRDARALAGRLVTAGVGRGDRVVLQLPAGLDFVRAFYATQLAGAAPCALNPALGPELLARRVHLVEARLVITDLAALAHHAAAPELPVADLDDLSHLQITSGTTGESRAVMITHRALLHYLRSAEEVIGPRPDDVMIGWVPPWHDLGLCYSVMDPVFWPCRCHIVTPAVRTIPEWLETTARVGGTITAAPDFAYRIACRAVDPRGLDLRRLRYSTNGGEPVRRETIETFERRFGLPGVVYPGYGLAEATLGVSCVRPGEPVRTDPSGAVSNGPPMPGVEVRITGEDGGEAPPGASGEIVVRTRALFAGYFAAPEETRRVLVDGWLRTGDVGRLDERGELYILGRRRALIKRGGAVIAPREVEEAAERVAEVRLSAALGFGATDGATAGEEVVVAAEVEAEERDFATIASAVAAEVRRALGWAPVEVLLLKPRSIPRTENGKVRHLGLRQAIASGDLARRGFVLWGDAQRWQGD